MPVAHDSRISNGNRTECSPVRSVIIRLVRDGDDDGNENVKEAIGLDPVYTKWGTPV